MTENTTENPWYKLPEKGKTLEVFYRYDEKEGRTIRTVDSHDDTDRLFIQQAWTNYGERAEEARKQVLEGLKSPLYYFMEKTTMELPVLAAHVGMAKWRVKRHFKPSVYRQLSKRILERYAQTFDIAVEDLEKLD
jgi:hypothetical protein